MPRAQDRLIVSVDVALFTIAHGSLRLALVKRSRPPFLGRHALIGGPVVPSVDRDTASATRRLLAGVAGAAGSYVEQLMTFSGADRDPRGWSVSVAHVALCPFECLGAAAASPGLVLAPVESLPDLAFDHTRIAAAALKRLRGKAAYTSLPSLLLAPEFTLPDLKAAYEIVLGSPLNDSAFRRKIGDLDFIEEVPEAKSPATAMRRRPAQLYRLRHCELVEFDRTV